MDKCNDFEKTDKSFLWISLTIWRKFYILNRSMGIYAHIQERYRMIKSMTGFGRCEIMEGSRKYTVEMKSVNHRY